jgi:hypothetical protein
MGKRLQLRFFKPKSTLRIRCNLFGFTTETTRPPRRWLPVQKSRA